MNKLVLFRNLVTNIEYYFHEEPVKKLAFIFSPSLNRALDGNIYGGELFQKNGYDVINFKISVDDWYQNIPVEVFDIIQNIILEKSYLTKISYGSSMGGYAAILFSKKLCCDFCITFSPQYSIHESFDTRWASFCLNIDFKYTLSQECIHSQCKYFIFFDDKDLDNLHVQLLSKIIPSNIFNPIPISYIGHPSIYFFNEVNKLATLATDILSGLVVDIRQLKIQRRKSKTYLYNIAKANLLKRRPLLALKLINLAIEIDEKEAKSYLLKGNIYELLANYPLALENINKSCLLVGGDHPSVFHQRSFIYYKMGDIDAALVDVNKAISIAESDDRYRDELLKYVNHRNAILNI